MNGVTGDTRSGGSAGGNSCLWYRSLFALSLSSAFVVLVAGPSDWLSAQIDRPGVVSPFQQDPIVGIRIEGNITIPSDAIAKRIKTQPGRPADPKQIREDVKSLYATRWFFSVEPRYRRTDDGTVLIFKVLERPVVQAVEFRGNKKIKTKYLQPMTGLKKGSPFDVSANRESARRLEAHYHDKGFAFATVQLIEGDSRDDRNVVFEINEGPKVRVQDINFTGNKFISDGRLMTKMRTKKAILWFFGGKYDPTSIPDDIASLKQYYHGLGFFDIKVERKLGFSEDRSKVYLEYVIDEGPRYKLRNVQVAGNRIFSDGELSKNFELTSGKYFKSRLLNKDVTGMKDRYGKLGHMFARVEARPIYLEEPGVVDLVYQIDEDKKYLIRRINVNIHGDHPITKENVVRSRMVVSPGDPADPNQLKLSESRLGGSQLFQRGANGPRITVTKVNDRPRSNPNRVVRGQNFDGQPNEFRPRSQSTTPFFGSDPQGDPLGGTLPGGPPPPFLEPTPLGFLDIDVDLAEERTGRLMFGVGVNSDAGVVGSIVLEEQNFDILRPPASLHDVLNGTAWRGGGQRFRVEAIPGSIVSRYVLSWSDPYFLDTDYSLGVSAFFYNRFFPDWDEQRGGGRISLGRQLTQEISISGAIRLEEVTLKDPALPTPPELADALGSNFLSTIRGSIAHDTRDSAFLPAQGHFLQASFEQAFGDYRYPRLEAEARQYFTVHSRPDDSGRHVLSVGGQVNWTDSNTPIFEKYYAGGFQTFRGFEFRGISPRQMGVRVGGRWMMLGSVEYMVPITASDAIQAVAFTDFGTVEQDIGLDEFRVAVGFGVRIAIPAMGPVPLAFDFAVPLLRQSEDETQVFSFYIGIVR